VQVALWLGTVGEALAEAGEPQRWLTAEERLRQSGIVHDVRRDQFVAGRWWLRRLLASAVGGEPAQWCIDAPVDGAPAVRSGPVPFKGFLGLAHSKGWVLAALSRAPLGVDAEALPRPQRSGAAWQSFVLTAAEQRSCSAVPQDELPGRLLAHWTAKEAFGKAQGEGLPFDALQRIEALPAEERPNAWIGLGPQLVMAVHTPGAEPELCWHGGEETARQLAWTRWRIEPARPARQR
jgi:phosphopantetheinyl transferase